MRVFTSTSFPSPSLSSKGVSLPGLLLTCLVFFGFAPTGEARAQAVVDSLEKQLEATTGTEHAKTYGLIVHKLSRKNPQRAISYAEEALKLPAADFSVEQRAQLRFDLAQTYLSLSAVDSARVHFVLLRQEAHLNPSQRNEALVQILRGQFHTFELNWTGALEQFGLAIDVFDDSDDLVTQAFILHQTGRVYQRSGDINSALDLYAEAIELYESVGYAEETGKVLIDAGLIYDITGEFEEALKLYEIALAIFEAQEDVVGSGIALSNIGVFYDLIGEKEPAIAFHERSLAVCEKTGQRMCGAIARTNLATIRLEQGERSRALDLYEQSLVVFKDFDNKPAQARVLNDLGKAYDEARNVDKALSSYADARLLYEELDQKEGLAAVQIDAGQLFRRLAHYEEAFESLTNGLEIAKDMGAEPLLKKGYRELFLLHEGFGEYKEALTAHKAFKAANDSLFNQQNQAVMAELRTQFQTQEQQLQIQALEQNHKNQQRIMLILLSGLLLLFALAIFAYRLYRQKSLAHSNLTAVHHDLQNAQQKLIHSEKMASLGQLTAGVAHEIRNPLNFIINFSKLNVELSEELVEEIHEDEEKKVRDVAHKLETIIQDLSFNAQKVNEHSHRADGIVQSMLEHANATRQERVSTNVNVFVREIVDLAFYGVKQRELACDISLKQDFDEQIGNYDIAPQELGRVLVNLFDNAIYAVCEKKAGATGPYQPEIHIETKATNHHVVLRLSDNGPGMPAELTQKIFEPFYSTKPTGKGTGLGLSLAYDIVTMSYGGEMSVQSKEGEGTTFEVALPLL
ncbi:MAG: tetratricopeptide repeat protein [Rhodothermales bacterium]